MRRLILCVAALRAHARQPRGDRSAQPRLQTRTSGESVHWNDLCGSYEVRRSRHGETFAVFLRAADVAAYCGAGLAALAAWAGDFDRVYFVLPAAADGARAAVVAGCAGDAAVALNRPALEAPCGEPTSRGACGNGTSAG